MSILSDINVQLWYGFIICSDNIPNFIHKLLFVLNYQPNTMEYYYGHT